MTAETLTIDSHGTTPYNVHVHIDAGTDLQLLGIWAADDAMQFDVGVPLSCERPGGGQRRTSACRWRAGSLWGCGFSTRPLLPTGSTGVPEMAYLHLTTWTSPVSRVSRTGE